jgi:hypothetical protein
MISFNIHMAECASLSLSRQPIFLSIHQPTKALNLLKPTDYVMHHRFNIQQLYALPTLYVFCIYLRTNSDLCHLQHKLIGFYNQYEKCLLRGTDWVFKYRSPRFVLKGLIENNPWQLSKCYMFRHRKPSSGSLLEQMNTIPTCWYRYCFALAGMIKILKLYIS